MAAHDSKFTEEVVSSILRDVAAAVPLKWAAAAAGISERTLRAWRERGENGEEPYARFAAAVTRARGEAVRMLVKRSTDGGKGSSNAEFHLERRFYQEFARRTYTENKTDVTVTEDPTKETARELLRMAKAEAIRKKLEDR